MLTESRGGGGGYMTKFYTGRLQHKVQTVDAGILGGSGTQERRGWKLSGRSEKRGWGVGLPLGLMETREK